MKRTFLRVVSMCLAVLMLVGAANLSVFASQIDTGNDTQTLQSTVRANVARNESVIEINEKQILAELYAQLSAEEKAVLVSDALIGKSYTIVKPADCIVVDADNKKVSAKENVPGDANHVWNPTVARIIVNGVTEMTVDIVNGEASFAGLAATNYMVEVDYALELTVDDADELKLLNAARNLAGALAQLNIIAGLKGDLANIIEISDGQTTVRVLDELYNITYKGEGIVYDGGTIVLEQGAAANAIIALYNEVQQNGDFVISQDIAKYQAAENKVAYLLENGENMMAALRAIREVFADLCEKSIEGDTPVAPYTTLDEFVTKVNMVLTQLQDDCNDYKDDIAEAEAKLNDPAWAAVKPLLEQELITLKAKLADIEQQLNDAETKLQAFKAVINLFDSMHATMNNVVDTYADAYNNPAVKAGATDAELAALDVAVKKLNGVPALRNLDNGKQTYVLTETVLGTVNQSIISVDVVAEVWENGTEQRIGVGKIDQTFNVDDNTPGTEIQKRIEDENWAVLTAINEGWDVAYGVGLTNYTVSYENVPAQVNENVTCTVVFSPKSYTVTADFSGLPATAKYGQVIVMPADSGEGTSYTYTLTDAFGVSATRLAGEGYAVKSDITVSRKQGMAMGDPISVPDFIANSTVPGAAMTEQDKNVLGQAAIVGSDSTIQYGMPKSGVTLKAIPGAADVYTYSVTAVTHTATLAYKANATADAQIGYADWIPVAVKFVDGGQTKTVAFGGADTVTIESTTSLTGVDVVYRLTLSNSNLNWWLTQGELEAYVTLAEVLMAEAKVQLSNITSIKNKLAENGTMINIALSAIDGLLTQYAAEDAAAAAITRQNLDSLRANCLTNGTLNILTTLNGYGSTNEEILLSYYTNGNSEILIDQLEVLQDEFVTLLSDEKFLNFMSKDPTFGQFVPQILDASDMIKGFAMTPVNAYINRASAELDDLVDALLTDAPTGSVGAFGNLYYETVVTENFEGYANLTVAVGGETVKIPYFKGDVFSDAMVAELENTILGLMQNVEASLGGAAKYYEAPNYQSYLPTVGESVEAYLVRVNESIALVYTPIVYNISIEGSVDTIPSVTYKGGDTVIELPTPTTKQTSYTYIIAGVEVTDVAYNKSGNPKKIKLSDYAIDFDHLFTSTDAIIKRVEVNVTDKHFLEFVDALNNAFRAAGADMTFIPTYDILRSSMTDDIDYRYGLVLRVGAGSTSMSIGAMQDPLLAALGSYNSIALEDQAFFDGAKISVQAIIEMLSNSGLSMDGIYNMIDNNGSIITNTELKDLNSMSGSLNNVGGLIMSNTMTLSRDIGDGETETFNVALYTSLSGTSSTLLAAKKAIGTIKNYVNLSADEGVFDLELDMPDQLYPYYMSAMILLDQTSFDNVQTGMDLQTTMDYYKDMIYGLTGQDNFSTETIENSLAEIGRSVDLSAYADTFKTVKGLINFILDENNEQLQINVLESTHKNYKAQMTVAASPLFDRLPAQYELVKMLIAEATPGATLDLTYNVTIKDREINYTAMVFDNSESGLNKFYYTADLGSALAGLGNNSVVILMNDANVGNVTISSNAFINLNGFTITGNLNTSARVTISDSTLHTTGNGVGGVDGALTGNFILTGGKYTQTPAASMIKAGYELVDGCVANIYYTIEEDANGNISINIPADILSKTTVPEIKAMAVDMAMDIAFKIYNAGALYVDGNDIYSFATEDLLSFASKSVRGIADELISKVDTDNIRALAEQIYHELLDFETISANIKSENGVIADYALTTYGWAFASGVSAKNTVKIDLVEGEKIDRVLSIAVVGTEEEKNLLSALFAEMAKTIEFAPSIGKFSISYSGGLSVDYSGALTAGINLSHNNNYAALIIAAVASATNDAALKNVLANYLADPSYANINAMATAIENITLSQFIKGLKHLKNVDCATMLAGLGVSSAEIVALEEIYGDLIYIAGVMLERFDIDGGNQMLKYYKNGAFASYTFGPKTVANITFTLSMTLLNSAPDLNQIPEIDLTLAPVKATYNEGENIEWLITVKNVSEFTAYNVVVTDENGAVIKNFGTLNAGAEASYTVTDAAPAVTALATLVSKQVLATWKDGDSYVDDAGFTATADAYVTVYQDIEPNVTIAIAPVENRTYIKGQAIEWRVVLNNTGDYAELVELIDDAGNYLFEGALGANEEYILFFTSTADTVGVLTKTVTVKWEDKDYITSDDANNTASASASVTVIEMIPDPDQDDYKPVLTVDMTSDKTSYQKGETITWTITVVNNSEFTAYNVTVRDELAGKEWTIPAMSKDGEQTFVVSTTANKVGTITNTASVSWEDGDKIADEPHIAEDTLSVTVTEPTTPPTPGTPSGGGSSRPAIKDPKLDTAISSDKMMGATVLTVDSIKYLHLDIHVDGMTVAEVLDALKIQTTGSRVEVQTEILNTKTVGDQEYVVTGSVLKITASNYAGKVEKEYVIVIDGDVNCDGLVNSGDAVYIAWHYCDIAEIDGAAAMIAATGNTKDKDVQVDDALRIVLKYLQWNTGSDR